MTRFNKGWDDDPVIKGIEADFAEMLREGDIDILDPEQRDAITVALIFLNCHITAHNPTKLIAGMAKLLTSTRGDYET